jgi:hypothetical protein
MPSFRLSAGLSRLLRDTVLFFLCLVVLRLGVQFANRHYVFDAPRWWPLSIFNPRSPLPAEILLAAVVALGFAGAVWHLERTRYRSIAEVAVFGTLLLLGSNAVQGTVHGFVRPTSGGTIQYYHDARRYAARPLAFLQEFNQLQPTLNDHGRTHPPGAVLLFQGLIRLTGDSPAAISIFIALAASIVSAFSLRLLLSIQLPKAAPEPGVFLLLLLPAVQIYYCASLDAVIAALLLGVVALFSLPPTFGRSVASAACLAAASFLTFGFVWVIPLLLMVEANRWGGRRSLIRLAGIIMFLFAVYGTLYLSCGFSYVIALRTAARLENPDGFRLLAEPLSYLFTRLEDLAEIALFTGPVLLSITIQNFKQFRREHAPASRIYVTALVTLAALFLTGAYRTGETARACLFICPYLLLPVISSVYFEPMHRRWLMGAVFAQTLLMQLVGRYFW